MNAPDFIGPAIGFRVWELGFGGHMLSPGHYGRRQNIWNGGEWATALCPHRPDGVPYGMRHTPPFERCECGIYAHHTAAVAAEGKRTPNIAQYYKRGTILIGAIVARGRIIVHGYEGFRAEQARPVAVSTLGDQAAGAQSLIKALCRKWGVWHVPLSTRLLENGFPENSRHAYKYDYAPLEEAAAEFGSKIPEDLLFR